MLNHPIPRNVLFLDLLESFEDEAIAVLLCAAAGEIAVRDAELVDRARVDHYCPELMLRTVRATLEALPSMLIEARRLARAHFVALTSGDEPAPEVGLLGSSLIQLALAELRLADAQRVLKKAAPLAAEVAGSVAASLATVQLLHPATVITT